MEKKYIVVWVERNYIDSNPPEVDTDHYKVFIDDGERNYDMAKAYYNLLIKEEKVYSANVCEIIDSTDY